MQNTFSQASKVTIVFNRPNIVLKSHVSSETQDSLSTLLIKSKPKLHVSSIQGHTYTSKEATGGGSMERWGKGSNPSEKQTLQLHAHIWASWSHHWSFRDLEWLFFYSYCYLWPVWPFLGQLPWAPAFFSMCLHSQHSQHPGVCPCSLSFPLTAACIGP